MQGSLLRAWLFANTAHWLGEQGHPLGRLRLCVRSKISRQRGQKFIAMEWKTIELVVEEKKF